MKKTLLFISLIILVGCNQPEQSMTEEFHKIYDGGSDVSSMLQKTAKITVFFGHQSVGYNITEGIEAWHAETGIPSTLVETREFKEIDSGAFVHFRIGENQDPFSKMEDFATVLKQLPDTILPIAFFKFCYIDILDTTQVDPLFNGFKKRMIQLKKQHPLVKIVLVTAPYTGIQRGWRALVKRVLFMPLDGELENMKRHQFNTRMIEELGEDFSIFDLGKVESTLPNGTANTYKYKGEYYPALCDEYTYDLGHLTDMGSRVVSYNLISFLAGHGL